MTLLPAGTEIVAALGGAASLVGISHECDYPPAVLHLPRVTATPIDPSLPSARIDAEVRRLGDAGRTVIGIEADLVRRLGPDLLITQSLCEVCAVADGAAQRLATALDPVPQVLALRAMTLAGIWQDVAAVGTALGRADEAEELIAGLQRRLARIGPTATGAPRRVLCVEWLEPLYLAGHWVPDLVAAAGGVDVGAKPGTHSTRREWNELPGLDPDLVLVMLCGFGVDRSRRELKRCSSPAFPDVPVWILDGNAYTSRPGPRVVDGAERIHAAIEGQEMPGLVRWRGT